MREPSYDCGPYPAFLYLEGSDQHRGWFQSSILTAVGTTGRAPFETVLTHGFIVDEQGKKMAKSGGNAVSAVKATEQYGADVLRLYVASLDYADDIRMSERGIKETSEAYRKIRNTFRYLLGNLEDYAEFDPSTVDPSTLHADRPLGPRPVERRDPRRDASRTSGSSSTRRISGSTSSARSTCRASIWMS